MLEKLLVAAVVLAATAALGATPARAAQAYSNADYWAFADRRQADVEASWIPRLGRYDVVRGVEDVRLNANMLSVHALAALAGHGGAARHDERIAPLAAALTRAPAYIEDAAQLGTTGQPHAPGWTPSSRESGYSQHVAIDPKVAEALAYAWRARDAVGLDRELAARIRQVIADVARSRFFSAVRLNQFNWNADMYVLSAQVTGDTGPLAAYRAQLLRFAEGIRTARRGGSTNLNAGLGLHYLPQHSPATGANRSSTSEYGNLVFSGLMHYDWAVAHGMAPLPAAHEHVLRQWGKRILLGEWTHAGYLNWDTGLGFKRWHLQRYWGFAQYGLDTLLTQSRLSFSPHQRGWAKYVADSALDTYERWAGSEVNRMLPSTLWRFRSLCGSPETDPYLISSRFEAHAARLAVLGIGAAVSERPPAYFAYDADIHRLAVSTPAYSAAITQPHATAKYGGVELARLYNAASEPVSGTGGRGRAAFGLDFASGGRVRLDTQPGANTDPMRGARMSVVSNAGARDRGTFTSLRARARVANAWAAVSVEHRFTAASITVVHRVRARRGGTVTLRLPVWGEQGAFSASLRGGTALISRALRASRVSGVEARATVGGYRARFGALPRNATIRVIEVRAQDSSPHVRRVAIARFKLRRGRTATVAVRLTP